MPKIVLQKIVAKDNKYLKLARSLNSKKGRAESGCFLIEGLRLAGEAADGAVKIKTVLLAEDADKRVEQLAYRLAEQGAPLYLLPPALLASVSATEHSQGIALIAEIPRQIALPQGGRCYAFGDSIADPGNLGSIIRSAYAAGVDGLLLGPDCADPYNPKTVRATMGGLFRLPLLRVASAEQAWQEVCRLKLTVLVTAMDGLDIRQASEQLRRPHLWVLGSEAWGVSDFWRQRADQAISLPMREGAESLNVAAAAAVLFYQSFFVK